MEITSKLSNFEHSAHFDRISKSISDLKSTSIADTPIFIRQMISLSDLLGRFERNFANSSFPTIDENATDPTYFIATYFDTKNLTEALWVYRIVRSLTRYILLSDRFYETGNERYALLAKQVRKSVDELLRLQSESSDTKYLVNSIDYSLRQFSAFWKFEQIIKRCILENYPFSYADIRHFNLSKSSDASLVYSKILDAKLPSFNENVALVLHYNQAMLDIQDDWEDIEDDVQEDMPNIFVMAALDNIPYNRIKKSRHDKIRAVVLNGTNNSAGGVRPIGRLLNEIQASAKSVSIPENFAFLKSLSDRYAKTLKRKISYSANS
jgi:hypothetical protein